MLPSLLPCSGSSLNRSSGNWTALRTTAFTKSHLRSLTNFVFTHSHKRIFPYSGADTLRACDLDFSLVLSSHGHLEKNSFISHSIVVIIIHMKKLLDSDWLRAVQFKCNTSAKSVTPVQITHRNSGLSFAKRQ